MNGPSVLPRILNWIRVLKKKLCPLIPHHGKSFYLLPYLYLFSPSIYQSISLIIFLLFIWYRYISELYSGGLRVYWDGSSQLQFYNGKSIPIPQWLRAEGIPSDPIDGLLWWNDKRKSTSINEIIASSFNDSSSIWEGCIFIALDLPQLNALSLEERMKRLAESIPITDRILLPSRSFIKCEGMTHLEKIYKEYQQRGKGIVLRKARSLYQSGKYSYTMLKIQVISIYLSI